MQKAVLRLCAITVYLLTVLLGASDGHGQQVLLEAESFAERGGWVIDPQFTHVMGSPYLLAHGLGKPVASATALVRFPETGTYHVWVRTKDWAPPHKPGRFRAIIDGEPLPVTFGTHGQGWLWQDGGSVQIRNQQVRVQLEDLTGFDGRCDAVFFTTDASVVPPNETGPRMASWRKRLLGHPEVPGPAGEFDLVVVGGGVAGCAAAVTAARLGLDVALIQERPVLGGNASSEIGIHPAGFDRSVVDELTGSRREAVVDDEPRIKLFLNWQAFHVQMDGSRIVSIDAKHVASGDELRFPAKVFVDCTGDAWIGYWAGADWRSGREGRAEFDESLAPREADSMTHGSTLFFKVAMREHPVAFPDVPWAVEVSGDHIDLRSDHSWEYGHWRDMIGEAEEIRDHLFCAIYGTFATAKKRFPRAAHNVELASVGYIAARGESRRLLGDYVLNENDLRAGTDFSDGVARGGLVFCLHTPGEKYDFRSKLKLTPVDPYLIPFRCLYSRNIGNLMMAGRNISATHVAFGSTKLMKTGGQMGVAVGAAAMLCAKYDAAPRNIFRKHLDELKQAVFEQGHYEAALQKRAPKPSEKEDQP